jgi:hypothetical protein
MSTSSAGTAPSPPIVRAVIGKLDRAIKLQALGPESADTRRLVSELYHELLHLAVYGGPLQFGVGEAGLIHARSIVLPADAAPWLHGLFQAGVRRFAFLPALEEAELAELLTLLSRGDEDQALAAHAWALNLKNVRFQLAAPPALGPQPAAEIGRIRGLLEAPGPQPASEPVFDAWPSNAESARLMPDPALRQQVERELQAETQPLLVQRLLQQLLGWLRRLPPAARRPYVDDLGRVLGALDRQSELRAPGRLVRELQDLLKTAAQAPPSAEAAAATPKAAPGLAPLASAPAAARQPAAPAAVAQEPPAAAAKRPAAAAGAQRPGTAAASPPAAASTQQGRAAAARTPAPEPPHTAAAHGGPMQHAPEAPREQVEELLRQAERSALPRAHGLTEETDAGPETFRAFQGIKFTVAGSTSGSKSTEKPKERTPSVWADEAEGSGEDLIDNLFSEVFGDEDDDGPSAGGGSFWGEESAPQSIDVEEESIDLAALGFDSSMLGGGPAGSAGAEPEAVRRARGLRSQGLLTEARHVLHAYVRAHPDDTVARGLLDELQEELRRSYAEQLQDPEAIVLLAVAPGSPQHQALLQSPAGAVLRHVDGASDVGELRRRAGLSAEELERHMISLLEWGFVTLRLRRR